MKFPQTLPDIRDQMQELNGNLIRLLDPEKARDVPALEKITERLAQLTGALTEAIVDSTRM